MVILVVDTVSLVRRNLDRLLSSHGHEVITADSGDQALEILKRDQRVSLVVTDLVIAGMTAIELFKATRDIERISDEGNSSPPQFLLLTSLRPDSDAHDGNVLLLHEAVDLGFIDILFKPLVREKLLTHLEQIVSPIQRPSLPQTQQRTQSISTPATPSVEEDIRRIDAKHAALEKTLEGLRLGQQNMQSDLTEIKALLTDITSKNMI